jgi:hypothetical protein
VRVPVGIAVVGPREGERRGCEGRLGLPGVAVDTLAFVKGRLKEPAEGPSRYKSGPIRSGPSRAPCPRVTTVSRCPCRPGGVRRAALPRQRRRRRDHRSGAVARGIHERVAGLRVRLAPVDSAGRARPSRRPGRPSSWCAAVNWTMCPGGLRVNGSKIWGDGPRIGFRFFRCGRPGVECMCRPWILRPAVFSSPGVGCVNRFSGVMWTRRPDMAAARPLCKKVGKFAAFQLDLQMGALSAEAVFRAANGFGRAVPGVPAPHRAGEGDRDHGPDSSIGACQRAGEKAWRRTSCPLPQLSCR